MSSIPSSRSRQKPHKISRWVRSAWIASLALATVAASPPKAPLKIPPSAIRQCMSAVYSAYESISLQPTRGAALTERGNWQTKLKILLIQWVSRGRIRLERLESGKVQYVYRPTKGDALSHDLRNEYPTREGRGADNKYLKAFEALRDNGITVIDLEDAAQVEIVETNLHENGKWGTMSHPWISIGEEWNAMALERHRIEAAERLGMPLVVQLTDMLSIQ